MTRLLAVLFLLLLTVPIALLRGLVLSDLVEWFTPYNITVVQAVGLSLIGAMFLGGLKREDHDIKHEDKTTQAVATFINAVVLSLLIWFVGFLWSFFV